MRAHTKYFATSTTVALISIALALTSCSSADSAAEVPADTLQQDLTSADLVDDVGSDTGLLQLDIGSTVLDTQPTSLDILSPSDLACESNEDCAVSMGVPAPPEKPCGNCYAVCYEGVCGTECYEAMECIFTAGCGPNCEPLCTTTEDCFDELGQVCVEGICEEGSEAPAPDEQE